MIMVGRVRLEEDDSVEWMTAMPVSLKFERREAKAFSKVLSTSFPRFFTSLNLGVFRS